MLKTIGFRGATRARLGLLRKNLILTRFWIYLEQLALLKDLNLLSKINQIREERATYSHIFGKKIRLTPPNFVFASNL